MDTDFTSLSAFVFRCPNCGQCLAEDAPFHLNLDFVALLGGDTILSPEYSDHTPLSEHCGLDIGVCLVCQHQFLFVSLRAIKATLGFEADDRVFFSLDQQFPCGGIFAPVNVGGQVWLAHAASVPEGTLHTWISQPFAKQPFPASPPWKSPWSAVRAHGETIASAGWQTLLKNVCLKHQPVL